MSPTTAGPSFATHLLEDGCGIRIVRDVLGRKEVKTAMICAAHVAPLPGEPRLLYRSKRRAGVLYGAV